MTELVKADSNFELALAEGDYRRLLGDHQERTLVATISNHLQGWCEASALSPPLCLSVWQSLGLEEALELSFFSPLSFICWSNQIISLDYASPWWCLTCFPMLFLGTDSLYCYFFLTFIFIKIPLFIHKM